MRFTRVTIFIAIGTFLLASVPASAGPIYTFVGDGFSVVSQPTSSWDNASHLYTPTDPDYTVIKSLGPFDCAAYSKRCVFIFKEDGME